MSCPNCGNPLSEVSGRLDQSHVCERCGLITNIKLPEANEWFLVGNELMLGRKIQAIQHLKKAMRSDIRTAKLALEALCAGMNLHFFQYQQQDCHKPFQLIDPVIYDPQCTFCGSFDVKELGRKE